MSKYLHIDDECEASKQVLDSDLTVYELKSIVIHRGGPYGGHYHAFIRDDLGEGKWDLELPEKFDDKPKDTTLKEEEKKEEDGKEEKKDGEEEKKGDDEKKEDEEEEKGPDWIDESKINWKKMNKKEKKDMNKKL